MFNKVRLKSALKTLNTHFKENGELLSETRLDDWNVKVVKNKVVFKPLNKPRQPFLVFVVENKKVTVSTGGNTVI